MELIRVTPQNLETEHICCAISSNKDCQVVSKKAWLAERFTEGLVFLKGDVRGKCFIEYIPAEYAWAPISADGYMYIDCFWVSGKYKGLGISNLLLAECIRDAKEQGKLGLCVLSSAKKKPYLSDPGYLRYKGFETADSAKPFFELLYLPFTDHASKPSFLPHVKEPQASGEGFVLYYTGQCPFTAKYVPFVEAAAAERGIAFSSIKIDTRQKAKNAPAAATSYALFYNGAYVTNEILSVKKFLDIYETCQKNEAAER